MTTKQEEVAHFIRLIRGLSPQWLRYACTHGGCHRFHLVLKNRFPEAVAYKTYIDRGRYGHVVSLIAGLYWDAWGQHCPKTDGKVAVLKGRELERMSSCVFDEGYVIANPWILRVYDAREPPQEGTTVR